MIPVIRAALLRRRYWATDRERLPEADGAFLWTGHARGAGPSGLLGGREEACPFIQS
jgi:hypothetical protein